MTTIDDEPRGVPLREVFSPGDYADVRRRLRRGRWWRFLNAKDRLLALARRAGRTAADLTARAVARFRPEGTAPAVGRAVRWAAGRAGLAAAALRAAGPVPTLTWAASTRRGQTVLGAAARTAGTWVAAVGRTGAGVLARLGTPGQRVLSWLRANRRRYREVLAKVAAHPVATATLANWRLLVDLMGAWARERVLGGLLARFLPGRYSLLVRLTLGALLVPGRLRHTLPGLARQLLRWSGTSRTTRTPDGVENAVRPEGPTNDTSHTAAATPSSTTADTTINGRRAGSTGQHEPVEPVERPTVTASTPSGTVDLDGATQGMVPTEPPPLRRPAGTAGVRRQGLRFGDDEGTGSTSRYPAKKQRSRGHR